MEAVRLPAAVASEIRRHAQQSPGEEVCGLIGADAGGARCYPVPNVARDKPHAFEMDPRGQIAAMRAMRARGEQLLGIYHSHPAGPPRPSLTDIVRHEYPDALYFIVTLTDGVPELRAFRIRNHKVSEVPIELDPDA